MQTRIQGGNSTAMTNTERGFMSLKEAAGYLKISPSTLYKKTMNRTISFSKPGGKVIFFLKSDLDDYMMSNQFPSRKEIENNFLNSLTKKGANHG
jgi:excisionase family DNA binding protein